MRSLLTTFLFCYCVQHARGVPPYLPPLLMSATCSDQQTHVCWQQEGHPQSLCSWHRDTEVRDVRVPGFVSKMTREQIKLPCSPHCCCCCCWRLTLVHRTILWSGWMVLGPNLARRPMGPPGESNRATLQCASPSCRVPACRHCNLSLEVFGQDVHLFLLWPLMLPSHKLRPVQLGWWAHLSAAAWCCHCCRRGGSLLALLLPTNCHPDSPSPAQYYNGELRRTCASSFGYRLNVYCTGQRLSIASLRIKRGPSVSLNLDLQVEPTLLHLFSIHSKLLSIRRRNISLSWSLLAISPPKMMYRLLDVEGRGIWSTFYNPYALQNNYSAVYIPPHSRQKVVASFSFCTDEPSTGELRGEAHYSNATLSLISKSEPPVYLRLNTQNIRMGAYVFSRSLGLYYSTREGNAADASGDFSSVHDVFYQEQSFSYFISIETVQLHWYKFNLHLYLNRKGALLRSFAEKDIEVYIFNSSPSFLQRLAYIVWFVPVQHPLLQCEWAFRLQLFDPKNKNLLWNKTYTYKDRVRNAARFLPPSALPLNPDLYTGFVAEVNCTRDGLMHAVLNATVSTYASKVIESTVACLQRICCIERVTIQKPDSSKRVLRYTRREAFTLSVDTQINCPGPKERDIIWTIYKILDVETPPDWSQPFNSPGIRRRNATVLQVPGSTLDDGLYLFNSTVKLTTMDTWERVQSCDSVFVQIVPSSLVAVIAGGNFQTVGSSSWWTLDGSASSDPDAALPSEGLTFTWYCTKQKADYVSMTLSGEGKCRSDQVDLKWTASSEAVQAVQPKTLQGSAVYYFRLVVQKGSRTAQAEQTVHVLPGSALTLNITCIENCGRSVIPTERFCLSGKCLNCRKSSWPVYYWSLFSTSSTEIPFDWESYTTTGRSSSFLCIRPFSFVNMTEQSYILVLNVSTREDMSSVCSYLYFVNAPPLVGRCVLHPSAGVAFLTKFTVRCSGFKDKNLPLRYKVKAASDTLEMTRMSATGFSTLGTTVYFGYQPNMPPSFLPIGVPSKQYALTVYVEIYDALGAYTPITLQAAVHGPLNGKQTDVILKELHGLTCGPKAPIAYFLENEDYFNAGYFVYMVASTLNDIDSLQEFHSNKSELREILLNRSAAIPTTDITEANQMILTISQITQEATEVSRKSQLLAVKKLKEVSDKLMKHSNKDLGSKEIEALATGILAGLSNVLKAALLDHRNVHINGVEDTISVTEILADLVLRSKVPGEHETVMEAEDWTITLRKDEKWDVSDAFSEREGHKNYFSPQMNQKDNVELPVDAVVSTVLYAFEKNPFPWLAHSDDIGTTVTGFKMTGTRSNGVMIGIVPGVAEMVMARKNEDSAIFEVMIAHDSKLPKAMGGFSFEVSRNSKDVLFQIVTQLKLPLQVFVYVGLKVSHPPIASFSASHNNPVVARGINPSEHECAFQTPFVFCLSQTWLRSVFQGSVAETLNISVVLQADLFAKVQSTWVVHVVLFTAHCLYLDGVQSRWEEDLCGLGPQTSWQKLHCVCAIKRHTSGTLSPQSRRTSKEGIKFLAGKVIVYPNPRRMKRGLLSQTHRNPVTMLTVSFVFLVYVFLAVWTMRKDSSDMQSKDHALVLPDNDPFDKVCYLLTIYTGSRLGAGTTADVFVQLIGRSSVSEVHCLRHPKYPILVRGAINTFLLTSKNDLGDVCSVRVWHNNGGSSPNWFLSRIKVENIYTKQSWIFMCRKWLAIDKDDGLIERSFVVTHPNTPLSKVDFFLINFANNLVDSHLWLSVFAHVSTGPLNRLQRLSCCLATLLCILLFNVMFFSSDKEQQTEHQPYLRPIIIGIESAFLSIPLQMIITAVFEYSQEEPSLQNTIQTWPKECSAFMSGNLRNWKERLQKWYLAESASKGPRRSFLKSHSSASYPCKLKQLNKKRRGQTMKNWTNCTISEGDANVIAMEEDMLQGGSTNGNMSNNNMRKDTYPQTEPVNIPIMLFCQRPQIGCSCWYAYVSMIFVLITSAVSSFFIVLYGLSYDYATSLEWLIASIISWCGSVLLLQTLNIAFFSTLKTLYPKYCESIPWSSRQAYLEIKLDDITMDADEMRELHYELIRMRGSKHYQPLEEDEVTLFKKRQKIQDQAFAFLKDVICHFVFLILILNIAYSMENTTAFYYNQEMYNKFSPGHSEIDKIEHIYVWLSDVFLPSIHNNYHPTYLSETWSKILGLPRMRQIRAKNATKECFYPHSFVNRFVISKSHCLHKYGHDPEEQRDHLGAWTNPAEKSVSNHFSNFSGFLYHSNTDQWKYSSYGELNTYGAGGYTFNFYPEEQQANSTERIHSLEKRNWLDENTWALIVELTTFNPDVDLFCSISVVFEISHLGPVNTSLLIHSYKLPIFKQLSTMQTFVYVAVTYILVFYVIDEFWVMGQQRLKYIENVANLINFGIKAICFLFLLQLAFKFKLASSLVKSYLLHSSEFIPFHKVSHVDQRLQITLGFLVFLIILKTLRYSRFFYDVRLAQRSILAALPGICSMALVVAVYFFVYMAFGYLVFGQHEWNYNTMIHSAQTVFSYCVSAFKDTAFTSNRVLGGFYLATFMMVMICVLINLFQAVIMSAYEDMKQPVYEEPSNEAEVVHFLVHKIWRIWFFVTCRKPPANDSDLFNRVLFGHPERRNPRHLGLKTRKINGRKMVYLVI